MQSLDQRSAAERLSAETERRQLLSAQARALIAGTPAATLRTQPPELKSLSLHPPIDRSEAIKALGLSRKNVRMRPVVSGYTPCKTRKPIVFPHIPGQSLTKLSRDVSREWVQLLISMSSCSLVGGKLSGSQGRNLVRIVEELRKHCYLKVDESGSPTQVREQVVQVVDGDSFCFASECGMSPRTFYRALQHPLAHLFIRTQKVQRTELGGEARRNVATLFSVALYEPLIPVDIEMAYWSENVELDGQFVVPDFTCQDGRTKGRPLNIQKQKVACGKLTDALRGASFYDAKDEIRRQFLGWIDAAALNTAPRQPFELEKKEEEGCLDRLRSANPELWSIAAQIAIHHDEPITHGVAAVGFYKALIHIGVPRVKYCVQKIEKWQLKGQKIQTPGRLLMHLLNREARKITGFEIHDLGTESGQHIN